MSTEGRDKYFEKMFREKPPSGNKPLDRQKDALERAHDIRKFEIDLYWKRATYFWAFQVAIFAGLLASFKGDDPIYFFPIIFSFLGFMTSIAWFYVNKGAKFWHENWELHIDLLEEQITGNLHKNVLCYEENKDNTFSLSRINVMTSFIFLMVWAFLFVVFSMPDKLREFLIVFLKDDCVIWLAFLITVAIVCVVPFLIKDKYKTQFSTSIKEHGEELDVYKDDEDKTKKLCIRTREISGTKVARE